jgi:predicted amidohydrolase
VSEALTIALAQLEIEPAAVERNTAAAERAIADAADRGADLVVLPEIFTVGYFAFDAYAAAAEGLEGATLTRIARTADRAGVGVLAGSIVEDLAESAANGIDVPSQAGLANASVLFDRDGERRAVYRKRHLFGYDSAESEMLTSGETLPVVAFEGFQVGITTCYDLRFPELYRSLVDRGATLTLVPSAWPYPRVEHWELLGRTRAVENLMYVAAANGVGSFEDGTLLGRSTVYDPWGTTVAASGDEATIVMARLHPERVASVREEFPALADRRS